MNKKLKSLPFDERNQQDFETITENIIKALQLIEQNPKIPATQNKLAELSKCSRKTLYNRKGSIEALKEIKKARNSKRMESSLKVANIAERDNNENGSENNSQLIKNYQTQNGQLFNQVLELKEQVAELLSANSIYEEDTKILKEENIRLNIELLELKRKHESKKDAKIIKLVR